MRICVQSQDLVDDIGMHDAYAAIREAGFEAIDWNIDHAWKFSDLIKAEKLEGLSIFEKSEKEILDYYAAELAVIKENGLGISQAHAPFPAYDPKRPEILDYAIGIYKNVIRFCAKVGCPRIIIHGISRQPSWNSMTNESCAELNAKLYESLIPVLQEVKSVTVCLENIPMWDNVGFKTSLTAGHCTNPDRTAAEIDALNEKAGAEYFGLCLDVGHLNICRTPLYDYIPTVGKRLKALHIHDNDQTNDLHMMPYTGTVRWDFFIRELRAAGYDGDLSFETFAQVRCARIPKALIPSFLRTIADTAKYFREQILK